jgi:hypothetical protein
MYIADRFDSVYSFGTEKVGFPEVLSVPYSVRCNQNMIRHLGKSLLGLHIFYTTPEGYNAFVRKEYGENTNYMTYFEVYFNTQIGNHMTEKELRDRYLSYCLPHKDCSIDVYAKVNDKTFFTFYINTEVKISVNDTYRIQNIGGDYTFTCCDVQSDRITFIFDGNIDFFLTPNQKTLIKIAGDGDDSIVYTAWDNFVHIDTITTDKYVHKTSHNLDIHAKVALPEIHTIQFKLVCKGTKKHSVEIFDLFYSLRQQQV